MHTEEEAKKLWCPMARQAYGDSSGIAGVNLMQGASIFVPCRASACGMWRWSVTPEQAKKLSIQARTDGIRPHNSIEKGHCGLAGKPHNQDGPP